MSICDAANLQKKRRGIEAVCVSVAESQPVRDFDTRSLRSQGTSFCKLASSLTKARRGGANRDRTDDLKLAKLALSQLSYGPVVC